MRRPRTYPPVAYELPGGGTYCPGCIIGALQAAVPALAEWDESSGDAEEDLAEIAHHYAIDPDNEDDVKSWLWPRAIRTPPRTFCDTCMKWFK